MDIGAFSAGARSILPSSALLEMEQISALRGGLLPEEQRFITRAADRRKAEFTAGRVCARKALARLGIHGRPIPVGENRQPMWPAGIVGSITHHGDHCAAVVQREDRFKGIGIDIADNAPLDTAIVDEVCTRQDADQIARLRSWCVGADPHMLVFSLKESFYKCLAPMIKTFIDFHDVSLTVSGGSTVVTFDYLNASLFARTNVAPIGQAVVLEGYIFSAVWVAA